MKTSKNIMLFEEFCSSLDEQLLRFDNPRVLSRVENLCLQLGFDCKIVEYRFEEREFRYRERNYKPNSLSEFIEYIKDKDFIFYPELNLFVDIREIGENIPRWILDKVSVRTKGMTSNEIESHIRRIAA